MYNKHQLSIQNFVCELSPYRIFLQNPEIKCSMGDFIYTEYKFEDIQVGMFKYVNPREPNMDGLIYKITYKNVSYLLPGDFDDVDALDNLLKASQENTNKKLALLEEYYELEGQMYEHDTEEIRQRRNKIRDDLQFLPTIRADIAKHPHHAYVFKGKGRDIINKFYETVNPHHIIYQPHHAQIQNIEEFKKFIDDSPFWDKFINSAEKKVKTISLKHFRCNKGEAA
jgi:hypothetical protein